MSAAHAWSFAHAGIIHVVVVVVVAAAVAWCKRYPPSPEKYSEGTMFSSQMIFSVGYSGISLMTSSWDRLRSCFHTWDTRQDSVSHVHSPTETTSFYKSYAQSHRDNILLQVTCTVPLRQYPVTSHVHSPLETISCYKSRAQSHTEKILLQGTSPFP